MSTDWNRVQELAESGRSPNALGLLELRARVEALDTYKELIDKLFRRVWELEDSRNKIRSGPESPLVELVADAIAAQATSAGIVNDRPARAAILAIAAEVERRGDKGLDLDPGETADWLRREANPTNQEDYEG